MGAEFPRHRQMGRLKRFHEILYFFFFILSSRTADNETTIHVISGLALAMSCGRGGDENGYNDARKFPNPIFLQPPVEFTDHGYGRRRYLVLYFRHVHVTEYYRKTDVL